MNGGGEKLGNITKFQNNFGYRPHAAHYEVDSRKVLFFLFDSSNSKKFFFFHYSEIIHDAEAQSKNQFTRFISWKEQ